MNMDNPERTKNTIKTTKKNIQCAKNSNKNIRLYRPKLQPAIFLKL